MRARLGLVEAPPPPADPPPAVRSENGGTVKTAKPELDPEKAARPAAVRQVEALLRARWPVVFCVPRVPLAIGIHKRVLEVAGDAIDPVALGRFMHWWVRKWDYLDAIAHGEARRNLDGSPAGEPDEPQRREAARQVYGARAEVVLARIAARLEKATGQLISAA
jgi:sRNA-binding protein